MIGFLRIAFCAILAVTACRRPAPEESPAWEKNPGLDPHPTGRSLAGASGPALPEMTFRLDAERGKNHGTQAVDVEDELYLQAARSGQAWAQTKIGTKFVLQSDNVARMGEGLHWLNAAADQNDTEALRVLSALAMQGRAVDQSEKEAYKYMRRAAELGSPEAQHDLSNMLASGQGMPRDVEAALIWGRKAADQGYAPAQFAVGRALVTSLEASRQNEGLDLLERAAKGGRVEAVLFLATALGRGEFGLQRNEGKAEELLLTWANNGNADCQFALATLYRYGETFAERRGEAQTWLERAAQSGNRKAVEILEKASAEPAR